MDTVGSESLGWALAHILKFGDTDIFPIPFEYKAIRSFWNDVRIMLESENLENREVSAPLRLLVPKQFPGFRIATQLDPYDTLLYLAMIYESANHIEAMRIDESRKIACSYRVEITPEGQLFRPKNGWPDYHSKSEELARGSSTNHVLIADISDFYNQIYLHRVQSALESSGVEIERSHHIEEFLKNFTAKQSQGIPVGPSPSILLAEACLSDVDNFLLRKGYAHTRYVDDFRIFTPNLLTAIQALCDLTEYLYSSHRLSIQGAKTDIFSTEKFIKEELLDPEERELSRKFDRLSEMIEEIGIPSFYSDPEEIEVTPEMENEAIRETIRYLFREVVSNRPVHLGFARYLIRRARALRTRVILSDVLSNIEKFLPIMRDLIRYLLAVYPRTDPNQVGSVLVNLLENSDYRTIPYIQYWILYSFSEVPSFCPTQRAMDLAENSHQTIRDRTAALIARSHEVVDWVRERKEKWANTGPWGQRAIIWAGSILPGSERNAWLEPIANSPVHLNAIVAKAAKQGVSS